MEEKKFQADQVPQTDGPQPGGMPGGDKGEKNDVEENKGIALLSYLGPLCLVPLLMKKESKFVVFHAKQGLILTIGWFFVGFPFIGQILWAILAIFSVWGILNVLSGKYTELPVVADLAKKINI